MEQEVTTPRIRVKDTPLLGGETLPSVIFAKVTEMPSHVGFEPYLESKGLPDCCSNPINLLFSVH